MSAIPLIPTDPFTTAPLSEEAELQRLARALTLAEHFALLLACCNQPAHRQQLIATLRNELPQMNIQEIHFDQPICYLLDELRGRLAEPMPDAVFVSGLEHSLPAAAEAETAPLMSSLNAVRNSFPLILPRPLVLWVPEYVLNAIARGAPDFLSIRSGVYFFTTYSDEFANLAYPLSATELWAIADLSLAEKQEHIASIKSLLAEYESLPDNQRGYTAEMRQHWQLASFLLKLGSYANAQYHYQRALALARKVGDRYWEGMILKGIGSTFLFQDLPHEAETAYQQSLIIFREMGDRLREGRTLNELGIIYDRQAHWKAESAFRQSLAIAREMGDRVGEGWAIGNLGNVYLTQGRWAEAERAYQESLAIFREVGHPVGEAGALRNLGNLYQNQGRWAEAEKCYQQDLAISRQVGDRVSEGTTLRALALLRDAQGDITEALRLGQQAVAVLEKTEAQQMLTETRKLVERWELQA